MSELPEERKLLILDLDETLIHATEIPLERPADFRAGRFHVYKRPHVDAFLAACLARFDTAVWTSASPHYAASVVRSLLPDPAALAFLWCGDRCTQRANPESGEYYWRKPLIKVWRRRHYRREAIIAVDDTPQKWEQSYGNLVAVRPYFGDPEDDELTHLLTYLDYLRTVPNIRRVEKRGWRPRTR